jgi:CBS domain-containing protein
MNRLVLEADTARDLMTSNPVSISEHATVRQAAAVLMDREIGAVPVINDAGRPIGVLSRADIVRRERDASGQNEAREIMTSTVVSIAPDDFAWQAIAKMAAFKVHRLFVVDESGVLIGVISAFDVVRKLRQGQ